MLLWLCSQLVIGMAAGTIFRVPMLLFVFLLVFFESVVAALLSESHHLVWYTVSGMFAVQLGYAIGSLLRTTVIEVFLGTLRHPR